MPVKPRASLTLGLAVASLAASSHSLAAPATDQDMAWTCSMGRDGEWLCDVSEETESSESPSTTEVVQTEEAAPKVAKPVLKDTEKQVAQKPTATTPADKTAAVASTQDTQDSQPSRVVANDNGAASAPVMVAPAVVAAPVTAATTSSNVEIVQPANGINRPQLLRSPTPRPVVRQTSTARHDPAQPKGWDCSSDQGKWVCEQDTQYQPAQQHSSEQQLAAGNRPEWECDPDDNGNWVCDKQMPEVPASYAAPARAPVVPTGTYAHLDWVTDPRAGLCGGYYLPPQFNEIAEQDDPPLYMEALQSSTQLGGLTRLEGGVKLQQSQRLLSSNYAEYDQVTNKASLSDNVSFREPGVLLRGNTAQADIESTEVLFTDAQYVLHEQRLRGQADRLLRLQDGRLRLENSSYTYCPPGVESWQLRADNIMLDKEEGFGEAQDAVLEVGGVPIFYAPYFTFPIDDRRRSGFLYPTFNVSDDNGVDLAVPYYFNLAENYDDTLVARLISERGLMLENEFRYLNEWSESLVSTAYLPSDDKFGDDRWLLNYEGRTYNTGRWVTNIDYTRVSDTAYFDDLDSTLDVAREDHLNQLGEVHYYGDGWNAQARIHSYQTLSDDRSPYRRLPQLWLQGAESWDLKRLDYQAEFVNFDRDLAGLTGADRIVGQRVHLMPSFSYQYRQHWGYAIPTARLWSNTYQLDNQLSGQDSNPNINVPILSLDTGLYFDRAMKNGGTHTLEPRVFMLYVDEENQDAIPNFDTAELDFDYRSLFRYNRFSGRDRIGDSQQISLGLTSRWILDSGYEQARFSIGQAYYLEDRNVQLNGAPAATDSTSDIATETVWNINQNWRSTLDMIFDANGELSKSNLKFNYNRDLDHRFNFSYRFEENARKQIDSSFIWPLSQRWGLIGRWQHDLDNSETLESLLGVEYESCCWSVRLAARKWLDDTDNTDSAIYLQFVLKGLGGIGSGSGSFLNDIIGYQEREEHRND